MVPPPIQRPWRLTPPTPRRARRLARELGLPPWLAQVLVHRGQAEPDSARAFLAPGLDQLPPPRDLAGLEAALKLLVPAIREGRTIGVAGDYDADGITSTALMVDFLRQCGAPAVWDLPHRLRDGYGFSPKTAQRLHQRGAKIIVTVDCGISDQAGVEAAHALGLPVVVSDHHQVPTGPLVPAEAVINPQQACCGFGPHLAGVGVAFYLAAGLRAALREAGHFSADRPEPNLRLSLDLVALGTCADVVPLLDHNRVLVAEGLKVINQGRRVGLAALAQVAGLRGVLDERDLGFALAPRLNAAGRLDSPDLALELLLCPDHAQALKLAAALDRLNQDRRELEREIFQQALEMLAQDPAQQAAGCLVLAHPDWHRGVLGIVASRLVERLGRPTMLFAVENGHAVGSGRSLPGFHLQQALCGLEHLLDHFGGHALAAGATLATPLLPRLAEGLAQAAAAALPPGPAGPPLIIEAQAELSDLGPDTMTWLERLGPFGAHNPEPCLLLRDLEVADSRPVGQGHLKLQLTQASHRLAAIGFGLAHHQPVPGQRLDVVATPRPNNFGGRHLELALADLRPAQG
ncbi:MAG: single-stranded-DNA-specific exonuclease RecJ [Desulfarculus sp.]|nr:single-stranded-DNA-specific exonuclease RecJ [Desulfarculus sp.]